MKFLLKLILTAVAVLLLAEVLPGVAINNYVSALIVALVLAILNAIVKPILVILTLPATIITLGLFLLVINAAIILLADYFIAGFDVRGWLWALIFSVLLSVFQSILHSILKKD
ncbi:phage holin family protein [Aquimarina sp. 2304DJ70-9]|uniref:phage holin family protein n=1 Tax=Aquimarina penaris TaxID=3231044 RepID=UPI0034626D1F